MKSKPKFNKKKCVKCKYHSTGLGYPVMIDGHQKTIHCNYSITGQTCLRMTENGIVDARGYDYNHCKLYEKGSAIEEQDV